MTTQDQDEREPCDGNGADASEPRLRVLLFERDRDARELPGSELERWAEPSDEQLLWVDVVAPDTPPEALGVLGVELSALRPEHGGAVGLLLEGRWRHLYVCAINWRPTQAPVPIPLSVALARNIVVTVRRMPVNFIDEVLDNEADHLRVGQLESTVFAMALLDRMLTDYLDARDAFESALDHLELLILKQPRPSHLAELQRLRHLASQLRRHLAGQRDLFDALARPDFEPGQSHDAARACRVISSRYSRVMQSIEAGRELVNGSFDLYTSRAAESTNQAMHTLTVVTVAMGLAATIAGVLGMNFDAPVFESGTRGFMAALVGIGLIVLGAVAWAVLRIVRSARRPTSSS